MTGDLVFVRGTRRGVGVGPDVERGGFYAVRVLHPGDMCVFRRHRVRSDASVLSPFAMLPLLS